MSVVILEGEITELSNSCVVNGKVTQYEFVKIGGQRVRKVRADNYLDTFIKVGDVVRLSCTKSMGQHVVLAAQESNGEVSQLEMAPLFFKVVLMLFFATVIGAIAGGIVGIVTMSVSTGFLTFAAVAFGLTWLACSDDFKARNALNGMKAPVAPAVA